MLLWRTCVILMLMENDITHLVEVQVLRHGWHLLIVNYYLLYHIWGKKYRAIKSLFFCLWHMLMVWSYMQVVQQFGIPHLFDLPIRPAVCLMLCHVYTWNYSALLLHDQMVLLHLLLVYSSCFLALWCNQSQKTKNRKFFSGYIQLNVPLSCIV